MGVADCGHVLVALPLPTKAASSEEEGKLQRGQLFVRDLQVAVLPIRAIKQGYRVL